MFVGCFFIFISEIFLLILIYYLLIKKNSQILFSIFENSLWLALYNIEIS